LKKSDQRYLYLEDTLVLVSYCHFTANEGLVRRASKIRSKTTSLPWFW